MTKEILVTGGTGFIGSHLVRKLTEDGYRVRCLVRKTSQVAYLESLGVKLIYGDIREPGSLQDAVREVQAVFHLAGRASVLKSIEDPVSSFLTNTMGTLNLLEGIRCNNPNSCLVIYISSRIVYGNPKSDIVTELEPTIPVEPYGASKLGAEHLCQAYSEAYSIPFIILRAPNVYGPGQSANFFIPSIIHQVLRNCNSINIGNVDTYRDFVFIKDMVDAFYLALLRRDQAQNNIFNISQGTAKTAEILDILSRLGLKYLDKAFQMVQDTSRIEPSAVGIKKYQLDCSRAHQILEWYPRYSLEQGLEKTFLAEKERLKL